MPGVHLNQERTRSWGFWLSLLGAFIAIVTLCFAAFQIGYDIGKDNSEEAFNELSREKDVIDQNYLSLLHKYQKQEIELDDLKSSFHSLAKEKTADSLTPGEVWEENGGGLLEGGNDGSNKAPNPNELMQPEIDKIIVGQSVSSGRLIFEVEKIDLFPNGIARWHLSMHNKTDSRQGTLYRTSGIWVTNDAGDAYQVQKMSAGEWMGKGVRAGEKLRGWFEIKMTGEPATDYVIHLERATNGTHNHSDMTIPVVLSEPIPNRGSFER
ncbi:MAG: hypothetical protein AAGA25_14190 [Planctomycetota bacterium]